MIYLKLHDTDKGAIVAMCDEALIDKTLSEGDLFIDIKSYASFYKGELVSKQKAKEAIGTKPVYSANIMGKESVAVGIEMMIISEEAVLSAEGVPYAHAYAVEDKGGGTV